MGGEQPKAEERETVATPMNTALARVQRKAKAVQKLADLAMHFVKLLLAVGKQQEVIHVACVGARPEIADDHVVHGIQVDVGEELRRLVAERQPAPAPVRCEKRIAGEIMEHFLLGVGTRRVGTGDDELDETKRIGTVDHARQQVFQNPMIDRRKVFLDIQFQDARVPRASAPGVGQGFVSPEARAAGERVGNKAAFEDRLYDIRQSVVHHAVPERRGGDEARLGVDDAEGAVGTRPVGSAGELALEAVQFGFEIGQECGDIGSRLLASGGAAGGVEKVGQRGEFGPQRVHCAFLHPPIMRPISSRRPVAWV